MSTNISVPIVDRKKVEEIVRRVLFEENQRQPDLKLSQSNDKGKDIGIGGCFTSINNAIQAARSTFPIWRNIPLEKRIGIIDTIREVSRQNATRLAEMAVSETGLGRKECKIHKNLLVSEKTPGPEILKPLVFSGDRGLTLIERAPFGVIASITPTTNPTATIINNVISILSGGNCVVFNVHPRAEKVSIYLIQLLNRTIIEAGGPPNTITTISHPSIESAQALMTHPGIDMLLVTGGEDVVKFAMQSGKRAVCAGPGNPPTVVDETADVEKAAHDIIRSCGFDNNLVCADEKEVFVVQSTADSLKSYMRAQGAYEISSFDLSRLEKVIFTDLGTPGKSGKMNPKWIGQNAALILREAGFSVDDQVRIILAEVPLDHPLVWTEQMMPVLPLIRVRDVNEGIQFALKAEHGFHHTAVMHSFNLVALNNMANVMDTAIFVKNAPSLSGLGFEGEGFTSFSIGTKTGEGLTNCLTFTRERRCALVDYFRIV
jgi:aldehyde dehydrogenase